jgi:mono/diheme cytochrome c family protein
VSASCHGDPDAPGGVAHGGDQPALVVRRRADFAQSVIEPGAQIAAGFPSPSGMPPVGLVLEPRALRDLVAYLMTLD